MNTRIIPALLGALLFSGVAEAAPSIYPVDTARFLDWGSDQFGTCRQFGKQSDWPCVTVCYEKF